MSSTSAPRARRPWRTSRSLRSGRSRSAGTRSTSPQRPSHPRSWAGLRPSTTRPASARTRTPAWSRWWRRCGPAPTTRRWSGGSRPSSRLRAAQPHAAVTDTPWRRFSSPTSRPSPPARASCPTVRTRDDADSRQLLVHAGQDLKPPGALADKDWLQCRCSDYQNRDEPLEQAAGSSSWSPRPGRFLKDQHHLGRVPRRKLPAVEGLALTPAEAAPEPEFEDADVRRRRRPEGPTPALTLADWPTPLPSPESIASLEGRHRRPPHEHDRARHRDRGHPEESRGHPRRSRLLRPDSAKVGPRPSAPSTGSPADRRGREAGTKVTVVGHVAVRRRGR